MNGFGYLEPPLPPRHRVRFLFGRLLALVGRWTRCKGLRRRGVLVMWDAS